MDRIQKLKLNSTLSLLNQIVVLISGLIIPRFILQYYGSEINGLVSSITQFLNIITFLELGMGAVVRSALYPPIAENDKLLISKIMISASSFFKRIAWALLAYVLFLTIYYPLGVNSTLGYVSTAFLIVSMSIGLFAQYLFGIVNQLLLDGDQKSYVSLTIVILTTILNTLFSVIIIRLGASIQVVKLTTGLIFLLRPLVLNYYVKRNYSLETNIILDKEPIKQKWNGVAQHIAYVITNSTDVIVLSLFSTLENVSIYSVHIMIVNGIKMLLTAIYNGIQPLFGNLLAKNEMDLFNYYFKHIESLFHFLVVLTFTLTTVLINPFVQLYTASINDANYFAPLFSFLLVWGQAMYCIRLPYSAIIGAAGHFKETQKSAIVESLLNVIITLLLINKFGLVGVALGTLIAISYRTVYNVFYLSKNIVFRSQKHFFKHLFVDFVSVLVMLGVTMVINFTPNNFVNWIFYAVFLTIIYLVLMMLINFIFNRDSMLYFIRRAFKIN